MNPEEKYQNTPKRMTTVFWLISIILIVCLAWAGRLIWRQKNHAELTQNSTEQLNQKPNKKRITQPATSDPQNIKAADMTPTNGSTLLFDKQEQSAVANGKVSLIAKQEPNGKKINAVDLRIVFDAKLLKLENIQPSDALSLVLADSQIDNEKGTASIALAVPLDKKSIETLSDVATLNFQTLTPGRAAVSFSDKSVAAAEDEAGNVVTVRGATIIDIQ